MSIARETTEASNVPLTDTDFRSEVIRRINRLDDMLIEIKARVACIYKLVSTLTRPFIIFAEALSHIGTYARLAVPRFLVSPRPVFTGKSSEVESIITHVEEHFIQEPRAFTDDIAKCRYLANFFSDGPRAWYKEVLVHDPDIARNFESMITKMRRDFVPLNDSEGNVGSSLNPLTWLSNLQECFYYVWPWRNARQSP